MIGQTLRHYKIEEKLGEGGMGVVYRALDTHLDRPVAVKVLRPETVADPERKRRFVQEAKAASALNHPNILTIHDIDTADGRDFMVTEFVKGKTLDELIGRKGLRISEALRYAVQIADALARAHGAGIVHRDLKPANVMVTDEGHVKVLDFGLAKLTERSESGEFSATVSMKSPGGRTEAGTILGTVAYMSPEQAEGRKVDRRSDIFSFGAMLYEMITGQRAFQGETKLSTLTAVQRDEPKPVRDLTEGVPRHLEWIISHCLRKDPAKRFQYMDDVKVALEELKEESESGRLEAGAGDQGPGAGRRKTWLAPVVAVAVVAIAAAAGVAWWMGRRAAPSGHSFVISRLTQDTGLTDTPALSPDGKLLAYASDRSGDGNLDIWVQQLAGGQPIRITRHEADDHSPHFSPDGALIVFRSEREGGGVYVVPALGGDERLIAARGQVPQFSPNGAEIAYVVRAALRHRLYVVPAAGGQPRNVQAEFYAITRAAWLPDGRLLFSGAADGARAETNDWWIAPAGGGKASQTGAFAALGKQGLDAFDDAIAWSPDGRHIVFSARLGDAFNLWQIPLSLQTGKVAGPAERLTTGPGPESEPSAVVGPDGRLRIAFFSGIQNDDVWSLPIDTNAGKVNGEPARVTEHPAKDLGASLSADGKRLVFQSNRAGNYDIWLKDLDSGKEIALTASPQAETNPQISPDGSRVAYSAGRALYVIGLGPGGRPGVPKKLCDDCARAATHWSSDSKRVLYWTPLPNQRSSVILVNVESGEKTELLRSAEYLLRESTFSPDERWIVIVAAPSEAHTLLFIAPARPGSPPEPNEWIEIAPHEAWEGKPRWSPDGNTVYFLSTRDGFRCLWAQRLDPATKKPAGSPFEVRAFHRSRQQVLLGPYPMLVVARNRVLFNIAEGTGNLWMATAGER